MNTETKNPDQEFCLREGLAGEIASPLGQEYLHPSTLTLDEAISDLAAFMTANDFTHVAWESTLDSYGYNDYGPVADNIRFYDGGRVRWHEQDFGNQSDPIENAFRRLGDLMTDRLHDGEYVLDRKSKRIFQVSETITSFIPIPAPKLVAEYGVEVDAEQDTTEGN